MSLLPRQSMPPEFTAEAVENRQGGWYVFWESAHHYGARGSNMTEEAARALADRINAGEERP